MKNACLILGYVSDRLFSCSLKLVDILLFAAYHKTVNNLHTKRGDFISYILIACFLFLAMLYDLLTYKVSNKLILAGLIFGLLFQVSKYQAWGVLYFLAGALVPILLLFLLFLGNVLGAGDIKLFSVIGGALGVVLGVRCIWYSFVAGAILAVLLFIFRRNFLKRFRYFFHYLKCCFMNKTIQPYCDKSQRGESTFHFTIAIFAGFLSLGIVG